jgi:HNH endonuclease
MDVTFVPHLQFPERVQRFFEEYEALPLLGTGDERFSLRNLKKKALRVCRFCNEKVPEVVFTSEAHLVSKYLGNTDLFSDFECDDCNHQFGQYESDLASFLGISRSIIGLQGGKKAPGFVGSRISAKSRSFLGENILVLSKKDLNEENSIENRKAGITTITYSKPSYIPANVHRALTKAALSILSEGEVKNNYEQTLAYLQGKIKISGAPLNGYLLPFQVNMPLHIQVYERRKSKKNTPTHIFGFYFQNHIPYLPLLLNKNDLLVNNGTIEIPAPPPYFVEGNSLLNANLIPFEKDLSSLKKLDDDKESFIIRIDPAQLEQAGAYDPATDKFGEKDYNLRNTKYLIFMRHGLTLTKEQMKELGEFLKSQEDDLTAK